MLGVGVGGSGPDAAHTILTITDGGGIPLVTTAGPHGLAVDDPIVISGTSGGLYDGPIVTAGSDTPTTFFINTVYTADATGGSWRLA